MLLACRLPAALSAAGTRLPQNLAHYPWPAIGGSAIGGSALGVTASLLSSKHELHEHNSFFSSAARGWQIGAARRRRSIRLREARAQKPLESHAGNESTRLVVLVSKITALRAWDTLRVCSLAPPSPACSALALANAALA